MTGKYRINANLYQLDFIGLSQWEFVCLIQIYSSLLKKKFQTLWLLEENFPIIIIVNWALGNF